MENKPLETKESLDTLMKRLEFIAKTLSEGTAPLESTLEQYEEGIELAKECLKRLDTAEQRVTELRDALEANSTEPDSTAGEIFPFD